MSRPKKPRCIGNSPNCYYFKPRGIPLCHLNQIDLQMDEFEALRLADFNEFCHEKAAESMNISRATFGRIIADARKKIADALINGKAIKINNSDVKINVEKSKCHHQHTDCKTNPNELQ
ncbi:MAG: DUF134 domain-containing protein [Candidatus Aminicenantes bacterium]|nr:DUF134 domain-containing protein [Candidatus Aminicenantes bacterium]